MADNNIQKIKDIGVVGAGGAGFPTHVKLDCNAEIAIINGAECEPLLRVDQQLMAVHPEEVVQGLKIAMAASGAKRGVIGLKGKYHAAVDALTKAIENESNIDIKVVGDYYPAGDEQQLVYEITKKVVPLMGLPLDVGAVVINVGTAINIARNVPVTERVITINGAVDKPQTLIVPIGTPFRKLIKACQGPDDSINYGMIVGGPMMGSVEEDWDAPVTKTSGGIVILPREHYLIDKKTRKTETDLNLTKAICCQCSYCTELCPRNIIGLNTEPHKVMRGLANEDSTALGTVGSVVSCCDCNLCSLYACPMDLDPGKITNMVKTSLLKKGSKVEKTVPYDPDALRESKKVPTKRLISRIDLDDYNLPAPYVLEPFETKYVKILLKQHIGVPANPLVKTGDLVEKGTLIASCGDKLGANIHASITGKVTNITDQYIEIYA